MTHRLLRLLPLIAACAHEPEDMRCRDYAYALGGMGYPAASCSPDHTGSITTTPNGSATLLCACKVPHEP